ncbi:hypothetical protein Tco_0342656 [Tanacetum coccineum]
MVKECRKPKRAKDYAYHKEKMLLFKQSEKCIPLSTKQGEWLDDTDEKPDEQELKAHYLHMEKILEVPSTESEPIFEVEPLEKVQTDDAYNVFANDQEHTDQP